MNKLTAKELKEPGYYWWIPSFLAGESDREENWIVLFWHPVTSSRDGTGLYVGPLKAPCGEQP